jgi:hypothetical protein
MIKWTCPSLRIPNPINDTRRASKSDYIEPFKGFDPPTNPIRGPISAGIVMIPLDLAIAGIDRIRKTQNF